MCTARMEILRLRRIRMRGIALEEEGMEEGFRFRGKLSSSVRVSSRRMYTYLYRSSIALPLVVVVYSLSYRLFVFAFLYSPQVQSYPLFLPFARCRTLDGLAHSHITLPSWLSEPSPSTLSKTVRKEAFSAVHCSSCFLLLRFALI